MNTLEDLRNFLSKLPSGPVEEVKRVANLVNQAWDELDGNDSGGMQAYKLLGRVENPTWNPPRS